MHRTRLLAEAQADLNFVVGNEFKQGRERWVVERWLLAQNRHQAVIVPGTDPPDFVVDGVGVEVVEVLVPGRRRGDEYRRKVGGAEQGQVVARRLPNLRQVELGGHLWVVEQVLKKSGKKNYDSEAARTWTLLVYVNTSWEDRIQWREVERGLRASPPVFGSVQVVYILASGPVAQTIYSNPC